MYKDISMLELHVDECTLYTIFVSKFDIFCIVKYTTFRKDMIQGKNRIKKNNCSSILVLIRNV